MVTSSRTISPTLRSRRVLAAVSTAFFAAAYTNGDDVFLAWSSPPIASCWGFAIWRDRKTPGGQAFSGYIHNRVGFPDDNPKPHEHRPSDQWPFQRYTWTDHGVDEGDSVSYII